MFRYIVRSEIPDAIDIAVPFSGVLLLLVLPHTFSWKTW